MPGQEEEVHYSEPSPTQQKAAVSAATATVTDWVIWAAPAREYGRQDYRGNYHAPQRTEYSRPGYNNAYYNQPSGFQAPQQPYSSSRYADVYYNDNLYKPSRDPANEPYERGQPAPDALQAMEGQPGPPEFWKFCRMDTAFLRPVPCRGKRIFMYR